MFDLFSFVDKFNEWRAKRPFNAATRIQFYEAVSLLMENGVQLLGALREMHSVASDEGKRPNAPLALIYQNLINGVRGGKQLSVLLRHYAPYEECALIKGGERAGNMKRAFADAVKVVTKKREITGAAAMAVVYPAVLSGLMAYILNMIGTQLVPKFARMSNPDNWEGSARGVYLLGEFVRIYGAYMVAFVVTVVALTMISLPYLRGTVRVYLDRIFPWSLYRMRYGSSFLLVVSLMIESGVQMREALGELAKDANPWLRERIEGALYGTGIGANLGQALANSGFDFPDARAVQFLKVLGSQEGFETAIRNFGERWMDESVKRVKALGYVTLGVGVGIIGALALFVMNGASAITDTIAAAAR